MKSAFSSSEAALPVAAEEGFTGVLPAKSAAALGLEEFEVDELRKVDGEGRCVVTDHCHFGEYLALNMLILLNQKLWTLNILLIFFHIINSPVVQVISYLFCLQKIQRWVVRFKNFSPVFICVNTKRTVLKIRFVV